MLGPSNIGGRARESRARAPHSKRAEMGAMAGGLVDSTPQSPIGALPALHSIHQSTMASSATVPQTRTGGACRGCLRLAPRGTALFGNRSPRSSLIKAFTQHLVQRTASPPARTAAAAAAGMQTAPSSHQLLIVGPGVLGSNLGAQWLEAYGPGTVVGQTNTQNNHGRLKELGISPVTKDAAGTSKFPFVVFSAPPSGSADYVGEIKAALERWDGTGAFVFTSSAAVYPVDDGSACREDSPLLAVGANERTDKLLQAEQAVLEAGGCVVRLVGLYHANRGAHTFFLREAQVPRWGGYTVNLIHYEDAASLCLAVLQGRGSEAPYRGRAFLGCDGAPITFQDMMAATVKAPAFQGKPFGFTGPEGPSKGKRCDNLATREQLQWEPKYPSFAQFMEGGAADWYNADAQSGKVPAGMQHA